MKLTMASLGIVLIPVCSPMAAGDFSSTTYSDDWAMFHYDASHIGYKDANRKYHIAGTQSCFMASALSVLGKSSIA